MAKQDMVGMKAGMQEAYPEECLEVPETHARPCCQECLPSPAPHTSLSLCVNTLYI